MSYDESEKIEEQIHFSNIVATFEHYQQNSISANVRRRKDFLNLPPGDQALLEEIGWKKKLNEVDAAIQANARFLRKIVANPEIFEARKDLEGVGIDIQGPSIATDALEPTLGVTHPHDETFRHEHTRENSQTHSHNHSTMSSSHTHDHTVPGHRSRARYRPSAQDMDKLRSTVKQLVRDWAAEGKPERDACYLPITNALLDHFAGVPPDERGNFRVLVPGSGLARLALDIAKLG